MNDSRSLPLTQVVSLEEVPSSHGSRSRSLRLRTAPAGEGSSLVDRAYDEYCRLLEQGAAVDPEQYCARFPEVKTSLGRLLQAHLFLEDNLDLLDDLALPTWPKVGSEFAGFHLEAELGQGAFARVYRAREIALGNRRVAVKVSPQGGLEAATQGRIQHPNVVPVHSVQEDLGTGMTLICMPYLGRVTLGDAIDVLHVEGRVPRRAEEIAQAAADPLLTELPPAAPFPVRETFVEGVRWLAWRLADALACLHRRRIRHRDLKPSNILLRPDGNPLLLDFNLAADAELPDVRQGGTLPYMAPEQLRALGGGAAQIDDRADLFALGVILYELLTGKHPFGPVPLKLPPRDLRAFLASRQEQGFVPVRRLRRDVDRTFARWIEACLAHDPAGRPESAARLAHRLGRDQAWWRRGLRRAARRPIATAACLLLGGGLAWGAVAVVPRSEPPVSALPAGPIAARDLIAEARRNQDPHEALAFLDQALGQDPGNLEALEERARLYLKLGAADPSHLGQALGDFERLYRATKAPRYLASKGYCLQLQGLIPPALLCYEKARAEGYTSPQLLNNHGSLLRVRAKTDRENQEAEKTLLAALAADDHLAAAHHNLAILYLNRALKDGAGRRPGEGPMPKALVQALDHIHKAHALDPDNGTLLQRLAAVEMKAAAYEPARKATVLDLLEKAVERGYPTEKLSKDGFFGDLREEPRFRNILEAAPPEPAVPVRFDSALDPVPATSRP